MKGSTLRTLGTILSQRSVSRTALMRVQPTAMTLAKAFSTVDIPLETSGHSIIQHPVTIDGEPLDANSPSPREDRFAVMEVGGTQYKVTIDDTIVADHMDGVDIGDKINFNTVMLLGSPKTTIVGRPYVPEASVTCSVEELTRDKKVYTFKTRRRKNSRSLRGFRRRVTVLRVDDINHSAADLL
eukprot:GSChrysophyteH1.ASY1.ANO1.18.1 assembled CDS